MTTAFSQLFWGFLFTMLDFRINRFDILPDIVGLLLIVLACNELRRYQARFNVAFAIAIPLLVLSLIELLRIGSIDVSFVGTRPVDPIGSVIAASVIFALIVFVLDLVMVFHVCAGVWEMAGQRGLNELAREARSRWSLYLATAIIGMLFLLVAAGSVRSSGALGGLVALFFLLFVFIIVVTILFLVMLRHAQGQIPAASDAL